MSKKQTVQLEDGSIAEFDEGMSAEAIQSAINNREYSLGEAITEGISNFPSSAKQMGKDMFEAVSHPVDTASAMYDIGKGILQLALPGEQANEADARAVGQYFADQYGGYENVKRTLATNPAGLLADFSMFFTGGGTALAKAPALAGKVASNMGVRGGGRLGQASNALGGAVKTVGEGFAKAGNYIDPLTMTAKGVKNLAKGSGNFASQVVGNLGTGTGRTPIKKAYEAGLEGGDKASAFKKAWRGDDILDDLPDVAREGVATMKQKKMDKLQDANQAWLSDPTRLDFSPLVEDWSRLVNQNKYRGKWIIENQELAVFKKLRTALEEWADDPSAHTPAGLDALKRRIGNVGVPEGEDFSRALEARTSLYNTAKDLIVDQIPDYARAMDEYADASKLENQINRTFSLRQNAMDETIKKKFLASIREGADTNYGKRLELAEKLEKNLPSTEPPMTSRIAGEALSDWTPRGLKSTAMLGANLMTPGFSYYSLPFQSPKIAGGAAYGLGAGARLGRNLASGLNLTPSRARNIGRYLYQGGRAKGLLDED